MQPTLRMQFQQHDLSQRMMLGTGFIAAAGFAFVPIAANLRFGISLASTPFDRVIYGTLSIAADLMKIALPLMVVMLWRKANPIFAGAWAAFWLAAMIYSISAALGFAADTRSYTVASQDSSINSRKAWAAKIIRVENRLSRLGTPRPERVVEAEIDSFLRTPGTDDCKVINGPVTSEICPKVDRLRKELAAAKEAALLEADLLADRRALSKLPQTAAVADPQSATLNQITGIDEEAVRTIIESMIAALIEFGSALGFTLTILASCRSDAEQEAKASMELAQVTSHAERRLASKAGYPLEIANMSDDLVTRWALDRLDIVSTGMIQAEDAFRDFRDWCVSQHLQPLTPQMFGRRFTKVHAGMGGRKVRRKGRAYYEGAAFQNKSTLAARSAGDQELVAG